MKALVLCVCGIISALALSLAPTLAYSQTPELRPTPQPQIGLWSTIVSTPNAPSPTGVAYAGSAEEACRIQMASYNPNATFISASPIDGGVAVCNWDLSQVGGPGGVLVYQACPQNYSARGGLCAPDDLRPVPTCNGECGGSPVSGTPQPNIGHPININSGLKVDREVDYASADGLLSVERDYLSRAGHGWQTLMPGFLELSGPYQKDLIFYGRGGGRDDFQPQGAGINNWNWALPNYDGISLASTRRKISMVSVPTVDRETWLADTNVSPTGPAEIRLDMANGEYILFRRANNAFLANESRRRLVPVEHGKPGGYKIFYDYNDTGMHPYRVRDSLNRELLLTWIDAPGPSNRPGFAGTKVLSRVQLPDGTRLEYTYDDTRSSFTIPVPVWAQPLGADIRNVTNGNINVVIEGPRNRLRTVTHNSATGSVLWQRAYDYDYRENPSAMTRVRDQAGQILREYTYTSGDLLASSKLAGNVSPHTFQHFQVYINNERTDQVVRRVVEPLGRSTDYWLRRPYAATPAEPASITLISSAATSNTPADSATFEYAGGGYGADLLMTKSTDRLGRETNYDIDRDTKRPLTITQAAWTPLSRQTTMQWHPNWDLPTRIERGGVRVDTSYNSNALVTSQTITDLTAHTAPYTTSGQTRTITYTWGANARLLSVNGPRAPDGQGRDDVVAFAYDSSGNVTSITNALNHITTFTGYDANGRPASMTDPNGVITQFTYDGRGRTTTIRVKHPTTATLDAITTLTYDNEGRVKTLTAPASAAMTMTYDLAGQLKAVVASNGERIDFAHDAMGNVTSQVVKRTNGTTARSITQTFDAIGRMLTQTLGPSRTWTSAYDKMGNVTSVTSPRNQSTSNSFDALDRLVASVLPDGGSPSQEFNARDDITTSRDPLTVQTTFVRNGFGEAIQEINPDRGTSTFYYDGAGSKTAVIDGRGQRINFTYDILGRKLSATPVGRPASEVVTYTWDTLSVGGAFTKGQLTRIATNGTTLEYGYDHRGNITTKRQRIGTGSWLTLAFTYDLADRRTQITYPTGRIVNYTFDTLGRVTQVRTKASASVSAWTTLASGMTYEAFGAITRANYGNGTRMIQSWGNDGRLANRRLEVSATSVRLSSLTYSYDNSDNFTAINDTLVAARSNTYTYDAMDRITRRVTGEGTYPREDYVYDNNGNRLRVERRISATAPTASETDQYLIAGGTNRLSRIISPVKNRTFTYDDRGNLTGERWPDNSLITTAYDGHARLMSYGAGGATQAMLYNGEDERIRVVTTPAVGLADTRVYIYDLDNRIVGEYGDAGVSDVKAEYIWLLPEVGASGPTGGDDGTGGYMPLAIAKGQTGTLNWVHSHHNAKPIMLTDSTGATVAYSGHAVLGFPGQFANAVGLAGAQYYYNYYRDYDDTTGRYIQADPIGLNGDPNPYAYAMGNGLRYSDPMGLEGLNFFHPRDRIASTGDMFAGARGGEFFVTGHGTKGMIYDQSKGSGPNDWSNPYGVGNAQAFVNRLRAAGLRPGQAIVLAACNVAEDGGAFARAIARLTGSMVYATDGFVAYPTSGAIRQIFPRGVRGGNFGSSVFRGYTSGSRLVNRRRNVVGFSTNGTTNTPNRQ
jgi:RHS repeat-associated protein